MYLSKFLVSSIGKMIKVQIARNFHLLKLDSDMNYEPIQIAL